MKAPKRLDFTPEEIDELIHRLNNKCLQEGDYPLLTDILRAMIWLSFSLQEKELSIKRLRKIFGIKTESAKKLLELAHGKSLEQDNSSGKESKKNNLKKENKETDLSKKDDPSANGKQPKSKPNHGHRPSTDYSQAKVIDIAHQTLRI